MKPSRNIYQTARERAGLTQEAAAEELNYSIDYISKTNGKLVRFFQKELSA